MSLVLTVKRTMAVYQLLVLLFLIKKGYSQECTADGACDSHQRCTTWKDEGECYRSSSYMKSHCKASCSDLKRPPRRNECFDVHENCSIWFQDAECETNNSVKRNCPLSCGRCGNTGNSASGRKSGTGDGGSVSTNTNTKHAETCKDNHENCSGWAEMGECEKNPNYMLSNCQESCGSCEKPVKIPVEDANAMLKRTASFGIMQKVDGNQKGKVVDNVKAMLHYVEKSEEYLSLPSKIRSNCRNNHELCSFWASIGECEKNVSFMKVQCAPACRSCHLIDMETRCAKLPDVIPALKPGDLNRMFERIIETAPGNRTLTDEERRQLRLTETPEYSVTVHSRPSDDPETEVSIMLDRTRPPWVITFDDFLTDEECDSLIQHGYDSGYKRSEDVGAQKFDGTVDSKESTGRTSENAWCSTRNGCRTKPVPNRILNRLSTTMGIAAENSEDLQILKYEIGQFYNTHHDYIPHQKDRQCGPRILTFFLYLSDVEQGGGTDFPDLGITVMPRKGRAVLWPSTYNSEPMKADSRMRHQAMPVLEGTKYGANAWVHMYDYQEPQRIGCN